MILVCKTAPALFLGLKGLLFLVSQRKITHLRTEIRESCGVRLTPTLTPTSPDRNCNHA